MSDLTIEDFEKHVGSPLVLVGEHGTLRLLVQELRLLGHPSSRAAGAFSVELYDRGATRALSQGIYRGDFGSGGEVDIFIVPIGADAEGIRYEAIFN